MTTPNRALVIIDVQNEYFEGPLRIEYPPRDKSLARILEAAETARRAGIPIVIVQHEAPQDSPVFAAGSQGWRLHEAVAGLGGAPVVKSYSSVFAGTGLDDRLRDQGVDTVTLVGFMTNNCVLASAAAAEPLGFAVEVLSDATGAINLSNEAGSVTAQQVHETLMALLHSNFAAVADTAAWTSAVDAGAALPGSNLVVSATAGR
ncbi:putative isochorismatase [Actinoplanes missouriensis 431]|uniref:Putative isochorismatase n=1 Tax=Actinoplanes missouriensis (strain ATCC 14538 / DSM 43046 / CBS 188.64 / JCM 3121 / NBRC 102363 / NCIMB 12654 / NRRL B-3342 / UNCC 431) TaxID=512565 RepID=I0H6D8_ACTM4|nr:cysteine hydrolase family protein [Actinoplanes missouriensis]BAL88575.1 putative isochorismatase [Actinoplanes missouriensis 431]